VLLRLGWRRLAAPKGRHQCAVFLTLSPEHEGHWMQPESVTEREEFCGWCGKRRSLSELFPLVSHHEETRQYHCRREFACHIRRIWKTKKFFFPDD
jgi:hypothetical protein